MLIRTITVLITASMMAACAGIAPTSLTTVNDGGFVRLSKDIDYQFSYGFGGRSEYRIVQGDYRAAFADEEGTYYHGAPSCFRNKMLRGGMQREDLIDKVIEVADCGFYVPRDARQSAMVYIVMRSGAAFYLGHSQAQIDAAIMKATHSGTSNQSPPVDNGAVNSVISQSVMNSTLSSPQAGLAGGIAGGLVFALAEAERGRFHILSKQPDPIQLRDLVHIPAKTL